MRNCIVCKISAGVENISFHRIPKDLSRRKRWLLQLEIKEIISPNMKICSNHFSKEDFYITVGGRKLLKTAAVPTIIRPTSTSTLSSDNDSDFQREHSTNSTSDNATILTSPTVTASMSSSSTLTASEAENIVKSVELSSRKSILLLSPREQKLKNKIVAQRKKIKLLHQNVRRLKSKVTNLQYLITHLRKKDLIVNIVSKH